MKFWRWALSVKRWEYFERYSQATNRKLKWNATDCKSAWPDIPIPMHCILFGCIVAVYVLLLLNVAYFTFICSFEACRAIVSTFKYLDAATFDDEYIRERWKKSINEQQKKSSQQRRRNKTTIYSWRVKKKTI